MLLSQQFSSAEDMTKLAGKTHQRHWQLAVLVMAFGQILQRQQQHNKILPLVLTKRVPIRKVHDSTSMS